MTVETDEGRLIVLVNELRSHGCEPDAQPTSSEAVVRSVEHGQVYVLTASGGWVQAMQMMVEAAELEAASHTSEAFRLVLALHARFLGCRFGFDEDRNLAVQHDIYPDASAAHVATVLSQMHYVGSRTVALFYAVLAGETVDDARIDRAFEDERELS